MIIIPSTLLCSKAGDGEAMKFKCVLSAGAPGIPVSYLIAKLLDPVRTGY